MCDSDAAGSRPRSRSSAFASTARAVRGLRARRRARGNVDSTHAPHARQRGRVGLEQLVHRRLVLRRRARRRGSSGSRRRASARRRRCSAWTARGRRRGAGAGAPSSGRSRPTRRRRARRRAGRPSRRRSRRRCARRARAARRALVAVPGDARAAPRQRVGELVEEQPPQRALVARVAREQRALDRLRAGSRARTPARRGSSRAARARLAPAALNVSTG